MILEHPKNIRCFEISVTQVVGIYTIFPIETVKLSRFQYGLCYLIQNLFSAFGKDLTLGGGGGRDGDYLGGCWIFFLIEP